MAMGSCTVQADRWDDMDYMSSKIYANDLTHDAVVDIYDHWGKNYNKLYGDAVLKDEYGGPRAMARAMQDLFPTGRGNTLVLDVGAGTGLCGHLLQELGFRVMDGLDPSAGMLKVAKERNIYRHLYHLSLTAQPCDIPANTYDAAVQVGAMGPGGMSCGAFEEMARLVKPGGFIVNCVRNLFLREVPEYVNNWQGLLSRLETEGKWKIMRMDTIPNYFQEHDGLLSVFQVLS